MSGLGESSMLMNIILGVIIVGVIIFAIVSSVMGKKAQKAEREKRKKQVRDVIKKHIKEEESLRNIRIDFEKVISRKGKEYKFRDIFDVVIEIYEAKKNNFIEKRAYEIEGVSKKISKKHFETSWIVNKRLDLDETQRRIDIIEKKVKLTKEELKQKRIQSKENFKNEKIKLKEEKKQSKINKANAKNTKDLDGKTVNNTKVTEPEKPKAEKFVPRR